MSEEPEEVLDNPQPEGFGVPVEFRTYRRLETRQTLRYAVRYRVISAGTLDRPSGAEFRTKKHLNIQGVLHLLTLYCGNWSGVFGDVTLLHEPTIKYHIPSILFKGYQGCSAGGKAAGVSS
jgi:hypothetical protein